MKYLRQFSLWMLLTMLLVMPVFAHPGRTDSSGGHTDRSTGEYHYHHGYSAHDHWDMNGDGILDCPYEFKDTTNKNDSSLSKNNKTNSTTNENSNFYSVLDAHQKSQNNTDISSKVEIEKEEISTSKEKNTNDNNSNDLNNRLGTYLGIAVFYIIGCIIFLRIMYTLGKHLLKSYDDNSFFWYMFSLLLIATAVLSLFVLQPGSGFFESIFFECEWYECIFYVVLFAIGAYTAFNALGIIVAILSEWIEFPKYPKWISQFVLVSIIISILIVTIAFVFCFVAL